MNLSDIITKCYILALFIRDDGERLLLGDGFFEFKESLQHFQPNTFVNDVVELQGTDGQLLAGQVRRTAVQTFEGYIADGTIGREQTETNRRRFLQFFRKKHFYTVVYILPDGSAVQRDRGYIVNAPSAPELYQRFPEYSVGLNFEDPNYYEYNEDSDGDEIPAHSVVLSIANLLEGGLIWDAFGAVSNEKTWLDWENGITVDGFYQYTNGLAGAPLEFTQLDGNATQHTTTGKNLLDYGQLSYNFPANTDTNTIVSETLSLTAGTTYKITYDVQTATTSNTRNTPWVELSGSGNRQYQNSSPNYNMTVGRKTWTFTPSTTGTYKFAYWCHTPNVAVTIANFMVSTSSDTTFEEYTAGPSPNPSYPQPVEVVTGEQVVKIMGKNLVDTPDTTVPQTAGMTTVWTNNVAHITGTNSSTSFPISSMIYFPTRLKKGTKVTMSVGENVPYFTTFRFFSAEEGWWGAGIPSGSKSATTTLEISPDRVQFYNGSVPVNTAKDYTISNFMLEFGEQANDYEPYKTPSTHQVNLGKNLFDGSQVSTTASANWDISFADNILTIEHKNTYSTGTPEATLGILKKGTYIFSGTLGGGVGLYKDGAYIQMLTNGTTFTCNGQEVISVKFSNSSATTLTYTNVQLEAGNSASSYAPYFTPIELLKIDTYKDAFKGVDGVWYIHKEIGKFFFDGSSSTGWSSLNTHSGSYITANYGNSSILKTASFIPLSDKFRGATLAQTWGGSVIYGVANYVGTNNPYLQFSFPSGTFADVDGLKTWFASHNTTVYYVLGTATDTEITEPELLAQLNAIATTFDGVNNITITPSAGAQGELSVYYATGSIDVGAGYEWEEGSDTGTNVIVNNGIDSVNPTWIVPGPATNPTLTNITTGQTIVWEGSVASGQTLTVDLNRQTAELGGTNVFAQLSGDWVRLAPGPNKLAYSATGATEGCRLEWNGVVG